jgi:hypothetical protein
VFCDDPELIADPSVAERSAAWFSGLATGRFQERIPGGARLIANQSLIGGLSKYF